MKTKHKIVKRQVKHLFTLEETAGLNRNFGEAYDAVKSAEADFDAVKAVHKSKITEAESKMTTLRATINAGFEYRDKSLVLVMDMKEGKKFFYLESDLLDGELPKDAEPVITEAVTDADRQQELIEAEGRFEAKEDIELFSPAADDAGILTVGRLEGKWFSALRVKIGTRVINERLDSEQECSKKRCDQVKRAAKRFAAWLKSNLGVEEAKGFQNAVNLAIVAHAEREE